MNDSRVRPPKTLTPLQAERKERVLECTRALLAEKGYDGLQMRVLAERAEVAPMTLYNRFGNKDDLILMALQELLRDLADRAAASSKKGIDYVLHNAGIIADQIMETPKYAKAMTLMLFNGQVESPIVKTLLINNVSQNLERVHEMIELGELTTDINAELLSRNLSTCTWSTNLLWMKGVVQDRDFKKEYLRAPLLVLAPAMSTATRKKYAKHLR